MKAIAITTLGVYFLLYNITFASGLSVSPVRLDFELTKENPKSKTITVFNPTADVLVFEIYADEFEEVISAKPESFTLEAGARKEVVINVNGEKIDSSQSLSTNLSVVGKALAESKINVGAGAKLPLTITHSGKTKTNRDNVLIGLAVLAIALAFYFGRRFGKKHEV